MCRVVVVGLARWFGESGRHLVRTANQEKGGTTNLVKVDLDATNIGRTHWHHAEESVLPPSKKRNALVEHEKVLKPFGHVRGHRVQLSDKVPALLHDPCGGTVEPVIVSRCEIDDGEEQRVAWLDVGRAAQLAGEGGWEAHRASNRHVVCEGIFVGRRGNRSVDRFTVLHRHGFVCLHWGSGSGGCRRGGYRR